MVGLLVGMLATGHLVRDGRGHYTLGPRMYSLSIRVSAGVSLTNLARPLLTELVRRTGETALLGILAPDAEVATYIDKVESHNPVRYTVALGERRELHATAIGKLLLAYMDRPRQNKYFLSHNLVQFTPNTITSVSGLRMELALIVRDGISRTDSERIAGASAVAVPVLDDAGRLIVALALAGPSERMRNGRVALEKELRKTAQSLTELVSGHGPRSSSSA